MSAVSQPVSWASSSSSASTDGLHGGEGGEAPLQQLVAHELLVLLVALGVVVVGGGEQPADARVVGGELEQLPELVDQAGEQLSLGLGQVHRVGAVPRAADATAEEASHQVSCCIVAQRPCSWSRNTCSSHVSRGPLATTARPSVCTCIIRRSAFSFG